MLAFKKKIIDDQIKVFIYDCIRQGCKNGTYNYWLRLFAEMSKIEDVHAIEQIHIDSFLTDISVLYNGQHALDQAERAVSALRRYYSARGKNILSLRNVGKLDTIWK